MNLVGLDIGESTGFCGLELDSANNVSSAFFREVKVSTLSEYFSYDTAKGIEGAIEGYNTDFVIIEGYAFGGKGFFNYLQAEITGQVKRFLVDSGIPFYEAPISSMRKAVLGNGRATKADAKRFAKEFCKGRGLEFPKDSIHISDAVIPAVLGFMFVRGEHDKEFQSRIAGSVVGGSNECSIRRICEKCRSIDFEILSK